MKLCTKPLPKNPKRPILIYVEDPHGVIFSMVAIIYPTGKVERMYFDEYDYEFNLSEAYSKYGVPDLEFTYWEYL